MSPTTQERRAEVIGRAEARPGEATDTHVVSLIRDGESVLVTCDVYGYGNNIGSGCVWPGYGWGRSLAYARKLGREHLDAVNPDWTP